MLEIYGGPEFGFGPPSMLDIIKSVSATLKVPSGGVENGPEEVDFKEWSC